MSLSKPHWKCYSFPVVKTLKTILRRAPFRDELFAWVIRHLSGKVKINNLSSCTWHLQVCEAQGGRSLTAVRHQNKFAETSLSRFLVVSKHRHCWDGRSSSCNLDNHRIVFFAVIFILCFRKAVRQPRGNCLDHSGLVNFVFKHTWQHKCWHIFAVIDTVITSLRTIF